ncbi:ABC transporter ATP-binding protein [Alkalibacter saccharofermentans]|uniref:ATP-binding cassette, subfamily B n=1 Tax=Alkalibacter saccharofermentans DSM 14828 TaxID=1120975 RepID=A0A1M4SBX9_9FIRM|nr:ABC transporter ATP-binding protein [Alkalibacter saccharofermentans]SHE29645.1 ATP-binding cassette, subfamily B [Alkalibacter saccharofermentans DSM 14828]
MIKLAIYLKPFKLQIVFILSLIFLQTIGDLFLPTLMAGIINEGVMKGDTGFIFTTGAQMMVIAVISGISAITAAYLSSKVSVGLGRSLREMVFENVESFSLEEFDLFGTSTLITRNTNDINQIQHVTVMIMRMMISAPMMAVGGVIMALSRDVPLTGMLGIAILFLALFILIVSRQVIPLFTQIQRKVDKLNRVTREKLTGVRVIRAFDTGKLEEKRFDDANTDLTETYIKVNRIMAFMMPVIMLIMNLSSVSILWLGSHRIAGGNMNLGDLSAFTQYAMHIMMSMLMLSMMFVMVPRAQAAANRINEVLEARPGIVDPRIANNNFQKRGSVQFKSVSFSYPGAQNPILKDISFCAKPGEVTAIIGSTGSGKSTIANLLPRFYDTTTGEILIDGVDVKSAAMRDIRNKIGFVPQKAVLFSGTVRENIAVGNPEADTDEIKKAAAIAQAEEFILGFNDKYEHLITQGGSNLSGGQKQRLSIARALVKRPDIYIFDDSFSALDFKTDYKVRKALKDETKDATVIIIAQRVGTVMDADRIIVLDKGKITGTGKHEDLLKSCSVYQEIVSSQMEKEGVS